MAPFFFSIHREHFIRACVCVWRLFFFFVCGVRTVPLCARGAVHAAPGARWAVPPQPLSGAREPRDPRCLDSAFARGRRGRARWVGE